MTNKTGNASSTLLDKLVEASANAVPKKESSLLKDLNRITYDKPKTYREVLAQLATDMSTSSPEPTGAPTFGDEGQEGDLLSSDSAETPELPAEARTADEIITEMEALLAELKEAVGTPETEVPTEDVLPELPDETGMSPEAPVAPEKPMMAGPALSPTSALPS